MFTNKARLIVCLLLVVVGIFAAYYAVYEITALAVLFIGYVTWGYFNEGTVILAAKHYKNKEYAEAKWLLNSIHNPKRLNKRRKPYYEFILGNIFLQEMDYVNAELHLGQACVLGLREHDLATAIMHLANMALRDKDKAKGFAWIEQTRKINLSSRQESILQNIEKELNKI